MLYFTFRMPFPTHPYTLLGSLSVPTYLPSMCVQLCLPQSEQPADLLFAQLGEAGPATPIKGAVILSPPWNFYEGHKFLSSSVLQLVYSRAMAKNLRSVSRFGSLYLG